jgi:hypothetical protein
MKRLLRQAAIPLALFCGLIWLSSGCGSSKPSSSASSGSAGGTYMICYTQSNAHGVTVSSVFHVPPVDQVTMLEEPWAKDFRTFVGQSGSEGGISVSCVPVDPKNPEGALKDKIDAWRKQGIQVGQTNWKYAGG